MTGNFLKHIRSNSLNHKNDIKTEAAANINIRKIKTVYEKINFECNVALFVKYRGINPPLLVYPPLRPTWVIKLNEKVTKKIEMDKTEFKL